MLARSFSLASLLGFVAVLLCAHHAEAAMAQGSLDLVRDWAMQYDKSTFANTEAFCRKFRAACVDYVGPIGKYGSHHQLDCLFSLPDGKSVQPGPNIHAFCGGIPKMKNGKWDNSSKKTDYTSQLVAKSFAKTVKLVAHPKSVAYCEDFKESHPRYASFTTCDGL
ncbi:uncharacterized protein JCM10292_007721 [Rhodotorula paludigena]|uniref:uncharacterized protein n=1 Tax=Rhodotorula paludigena TaxID=86838 RepID=UPI00317A73E4